MLAMAEGLGPLGIVGAIPSDGEDSNLTPHTSNLNPKAKLQMADAYSLILRAPAATYSQPGDAGEHTGSGLNNSIPKSV